MSLAVLWAVTEWSVAAVKGQLSLLGVGVERQKKMNAIAIYSCLWSTLHQAAAAADGEPSSHLRKQEAVAEARRRVAEEGGFSEGFACIPCGPFLWAACWCSASRIRRLCFSARPGSPQLVFHEKIECLR